MASKTPRSAAAARRRWTVGHPTSVAAWKGVDDVLCLRCKKTGHTATRCPASERMSWRRVRETMGDAYLDKWKRSAKRGRCSACQTPKAMEGAPYKRKRVTSRHHHAATERRPQEAHTTESLIRTIRLLKVIRGEVTSPPAQPQQQAKGEARRGPSNGGKGGKGKGAQGGKGTYGGKGAYGGKGKGQWGWDSCCNCCGGRGHWARECPSKGSNLTLNLDV